jgi:hypothetical protein
VDNKELDRRYCYHAPTGDQPIRYQAIRQNARALAGLINDACPESDEKDTALIRLEEAVMWANASIARNGSMV